MMKNLVSIVKREAPVMADEAVGIGIVGAVSTALTGDPPLGVGAMAPLYIGSGFRQLTYQAKAALTGLYMRLKEMAKNLYAYEIPLTREETTLGKNGAEDDVLGYNFVEDNDEPMDEHSQGTHVAGTIAGMASDFQGEILPIAVLDSSGRGSLEAVAKGIEYAADMGADVVNLKLGPTASEAIDRAIEYAVSKGTIMVAAPGAEITSLLPRATDNDSAHRSLGDIVKEGAAGLALHASAFVWSTLAGITGDYASLGGYEGIYQRLEMGLARLRSK